MALTNTTTAAGGLGRTIGDAEVKYKGQKMDYMTYVDELEERADRNSKGKSITSKSIGVYSGFGKGTLKKPYDLKLSK